MARIAGVNIPTNKRIIISLTYIQGIGNALAKKAIIETGIDINTRTKDLTDDEVNRLRTYVEKNFRLEGDLRRDVRGAINRLIEIGSYRGSRHKVHLPARGQRTKTNSRTVRGNIRRTMGSGRRALTKT
ncbi:MAG: 30S ribosomal protein S13 [Candidatus Uhrbacteria bacterium GW2011_GWE2_40_58]|nr:MAG: 30S ribosomal protein S13 [Candidatus Uhrbacteria bacterium GW2011_GWF2_40_263]KKR68101.1 MAG: 30S ribosomal protein S13 [Candidatus Uhrbacteria bacterium GW2011_GWE2_40_58]OGL91802.1 MAG: 30S ribosomal protein S13 [Candidatus Uhrbacteria bacterium RIFOXYA2_FULL_40_9]OGL97252.1 MAG: 30S ribosomal protein S13 [Candidatus Uhrbacteria bacterium RIFOXYB2_FULL_41_18]HBK34441.1 30S ribosomal protein S13 [Candidatus Uhrbacteria bacterium]